MTPTGVGMWLAQAAGRRHLLFSAGTVAIATSRARVVERSGGKVVMTLDGHVPTALVEDETGKLLGLLSINAENRPEIHGERVPDFTFYDVKGKRLWSTRQSSAREGDSATVLVTGELMIVASFHRIATGSQLAAFDIKSGAPRWTADVLQLSVDHSKYWNDVSLAQRGQTVVMRGYESGGCYEQTFDIATGKRLSAVMPKLQ